MLNGGQIHHLAKRVLKSVSALFIPHAHMDNFMGIYTFIRDNHLASKAIDIFRRNSSANWPGNSPVATGTCPVSAISCINGNNLKVYLE